MLIQVNHGASRKYAVNKNNYPSSLAIAQDRDPSCKFHGEQSVSSSRGPALPVTFDILQRIGDLPYLSEGDHLRENVFVFLIYALLIPKVRLGSLFKNYVFENK